MIEFEWRIVHLKCCTHNGVPGVVEQVYFVLTGRDTETGREQGLHGSYTHDLAGVGDEFVPHAELTPELVITWLEAMPTAEFYRSQIVAVLEQADDPLPALPWETAGA